MSTQRRQARAPAGQGQVEQRPQTLYVVVTSPRPAGSAEQTLKDSNLKVLRYVAQRLGLLREMGVTVRVQRIKKSDLSRPEVLEALRRKNVRSFPCLSTTNGAHTGPREIIDFYEHWIGKYDEFLKASSAPARRQAKAAEYDGDDLRQYYAEEMGAANQNGESDEEDSMNGGWDPSAAMRKMEERRGSKSQKSPAPSQEDPLAGYADSPVPARYTDRANNLAAPPPTVPDFGGGSDWDPADPKDDDMLDTWLENQEESI